MLQNKGKWENVIRYTYACQVTKEHGTIGKQLGNGPTDCLDLFKVRDGTIRVLTFEISDKAFVLFLSRINTLLAPTVKRTFHKII